MEHRCGYRRTVDVPVVLRTRGGLAGTGVVRDLSASGAGLVTALPLQVHARVHVQFTLQEKGASPRRVSIEAEVVRSTTTGYGMEWADFAPDALRELRSLYVEAEESCPQWAGASGRANR
jgi:hypothetical protein